MRRQQPGGANKRPAKRSYASPLDRDPSIVGNTDPKQVKPAEMASFSFGTAQTTTDTSSTFPAAPVFGTGFSASASSFQHSAG